MQGLELNPQTGDIWNTEMGPRGGDELNRLVRGGNYGWPVFTTGVNYDGRPVNVAEKLGIELDPDDAEFPVVDMTPSTRYSQVSSSIRAGNSPHGTAASSPARCGPRICCAWKSRDDRVVATEILIENLARFRDIELGPNGELYVLLENKGGSQIVRLVPAD